MNFLFDSFSRSGFSFNLRFRGLKKVQTYFFAFQQTNINFIMFITEYLNEFLLQFMRNCRRESSIIQLLKLQVKDVYLYNSLFTNAIQLKEQNYRKI